MNDLVPFSPEHVALVKATLAPVGLTDAEFDLFRYVFLSRRLDPMTGQIHAVKRMDRHQGKQVMKIQTGIDGFRLIAQRTGEYEGITKTEWINEDDEVVGCRVGVYRKGFREPCYAEAYIKEYSAGGPMWEKMPRVMIEKCAFARAYRIAFPEELSGLYTADEMAQADRPTINVTSQAEVDHAVAVERKELGLKEKPGPLQPPHVAPFSTVGQVLERMRKQPLRQAGRVMGPTMTSIKIEAEALGFDPMEVVLSVVPSFATRYTRVLTPTERVKIWEYLMACAREMEALHEKAKQPPLIETSEVAGPFRTAEELGLVDEDEPIQI